MSALRGPGRAGSGRPSGRRRLGASVGGRSPRACAALLWSAVVGAAGCGGEGAAPTPPAPADRVTGDVKSYLEARLEELAAASASVCASAPAPDADGWSAASDADAVRRMRAAWRAARAAYERLEGSLALLFPQLDRAIDGRFEQHAREHTDRAPFDGGGFVGLHAIERILWADAVRPEVAAFERALPGYVEPATPSDTAEARAFREGLCGRLLRDVATVRRQLAPLALDLPTAWHGLPASIEEQAEKVELRAEGRDESRYSRTTLADVRANLAGGRAILARFGPLLDAREDTRALRARIARGFDDLDRGYRELGGDALPEVPRGFDPDAASAGPPTPFGRLSALLARASDPDADGSLAGAVGRAGDLLDLRPPRR